MAKLLVLYNPPANPAVFDEHFAHVHTPIVQKFPGLRSLTTSKGAISGPDGVSPYYLVVELVFDTLEALQAAVQNSPEGQAAAADMGNFAQAGATLLIYDTQTL